MPHPDYFKNRIAIVTGSATGIGRALCQTLSAKGARVVVADIDGDGAMTVAGRITSLKRLATAATVDVSEVDAVNALVSDTVQKFGRLDFMFNNAGIGVLGATDDLEADHWQRTFDVNLRGVINGTMAAYRIMREQGSGHVVNIASLAGLVPVPLVTPYAASKHAVVGMSLALRPEAALHGVRVSVVCPGFVQTSIYQRVELVNADRGAVVSQIPVTPVPVQKAAKLILRGVANNRSVIIFPFLARVVWWAYRLHPSLITPLARKMISRLQQARNVEESTEKT